MQHFKICYHNIQAQEKMNPQNITHREIMLIWATTQSIMYGFLFVLSTRVRSVDAVEIYVWLFKMRHTVRDWKPGHLNGNFMAISAFLSVKDGRTWINQFSLDSFIFCIDQSSIGYSYYLPNKRAYNYTPYLILVQLPPCTTTILFGPAH